MQKRREHAGKEDSGYGGGEQGLFHEKTELYMRQDVITKPALAVKANNGDGQAATSSEAYQHVDPYTLEVIATVFPAPTHGLDFLARLLRNAKIVQATLPGLEGTGGEVAMINMRTIRLLAASIHMAYDTTNKYVATFCALGLLHRCKYNQQYSFAFPLQRYNPPKSLQALDRLILKSRPKVRQFARGVKKRYLTLNLRLGTIETVNHPTHPLTGQNQWLSAIYGPMLDIMSAEGIETARGQRIVLRVFNELLSKLPLPAHLETGVEQIQSSAEAIQIALGQDTSQAKKSRSQKKPTQTNANGRLFSVYETAGNELSGSTTAQSQPPKPIILHRQTRATHKKVYPQTAQTVDSQAPYAYAEQQTVDSYAETVDFSQTEKSETVDPMRPEQSKTVDSHAEIPEIVDARVDPQAQSQTEEVDFPVEETKTVDPISGRLERYLAQADPEGYAEQKEHIAQMDEETKEKIYLYNSLVDLLELYASFLDNPQIDWQRIELEKNLIEEVYDDIYTSFNGIRDGSVTYPPHTDWQEIELTAIDQLCQRYHYNNVEAVYDLLQYYTCRQEETPNLPLIEQTEVETPPIPLTTDDIPQIIHERGVPQQRESTDEEKTVDSQLVLESTLESTNEETESTGKDSESTNEQQTVDPQPVPESTIWSTHQMVDQKQESTPEEQIMLPQRPAGMSEEDYKKQLILQLDIEPEKLETPAVLNLLTRDVESLEKMAVDYQRTKLYWKAMDARKLAQRKESLRVPAEVDSKRHSVDFNDLLRKRNINILFNNIYNTNTFTLRKDLKIFLAEVFDRDHVDIADEWFKVVDECDAKQLCAGFIDTIILMHSPTSKPIEKPGGFFNARCRTIRDKGLPEDSEKRLKRYGELTYSQLIDVLLKIYESRNS